MLRLRDDFRTLPTSFFSEISLFVFGLSAIDNHRNDVLMDASQRDRVDAEKLPQLLGWSGVVAAKRDR